MRLSKLLKIQVQEVSARLIRGSVGRTRYLEQFGRPISDLPLPRFISPRLIVTYLIFLGVILAGSGCTPVKPWQKQNFAKPHMALDPDPLESRFIRHIENSREGSSGGYGVGGGGCGCG